MRTLGSERGIRVGVENEYVELRKKLEMEDQPIDIVLLIHVYLMYISYICHISHTSHISHVYLIYLIYVLYTQYLFIYIYCLFIW
jgi:hypothetical protein